MAAGDYWRERAGRAGRSTGLADKGSSVAARLIIWRQQCSVCIEVAEARRALNLALNPIKSGTRLIPCAKALVVGLGDGEPVAVLTGERLDQAWKS